MADENTPIANATLELTDKDGNLIYTGNTNYDGSFTIENTPQNADDFFVSFSKDTRLLQQLRLNTLLTHINKGKGEIFQSEEYEHMASVSFRVINKNTKEPIENALLQLGTSNNAITEFYSDADGIITYKLVPYTYYKIFIISKDNYLT